MLSFLPNWINGIRRRMVVLAKVMEFEPLPEFHIKKTNLVQLNTQPHPRNILFPLGGPDDAQQACDGEAALLDEQAHVMPLDGE